MGYVKFTIFTSADIILPNVFDIPVFYLRFFVFEGGEDTIRMGCPFAAFARTVGIGVVAVA